MEKSALLFEKASDAFRQGNLKEAEKIANQLLIKNPDDMNFQHLKALVLHRSHHTEEAIKLMGNIIAQLPLTPMLHHNYGMMLLFQGDLEHGWRHYEWRRDVEGFTHLKLPLPYWRGENLTGQRLLVLSEQGFGDNFQFYRYLPLIKKQFNPEFICLVQSPELIDFITHVSNIDELKKSAEYKKYDRYVSLLSLPNIFRTTLKTIPTSFTEFDIPEEKMTEWRAKADSDKLKIGIAWAGRETHENDHNRSIEFALLKPILNLSSIQCYSLQKPAENVDFSKQLIDLGNQFNSFKDAAAAILAMDLIITVDTAIAHLAASLNKPTWVLLPYVAEWRWMSEGETTPWYPSVRLFRQPKYRDWKSVIKTVVSALKDKCHTTDKDPKASLRKN